MRKPGFTLENQTLKLSQDFSVQTDHPIPARKQISLSNKNKGNRCLVNIIIPVGHRVKIKGWKLENYMDLVCQLKKL